jgi:hypothetical protein
MDFSKYKYFYVNGCSHVEGGGLEEPEIRDESVIPLYKKLYGVSWSKRSDVNFASRLSNLIGISHFNDAKCGSGTDRMVRTTYDFLNYNWEERHKFFLILENPDPTRSDVYFNELKSYFIVNSGLSENGERFFMDSVREYFNSEYKKIDYKYKEIFKTWFNNHYNFEEKMKQDDKDYVGLYSFCKLHGIKIFVMNKTNFFFNNVFKKEDVINFNQRDYNHYMYDINTWCRINKFTIMDELKGLSDDGHPGYFGHIKYAENLYEFLKNVKDE